MEIQSGTGDGDVCLVRYRREAVAAMGDIGCEKQEDGYAGPIKQKGTATEN